MFEHLKILLPFFEYEYKINVDTGQAAFDRFESFTIIDVCIVHTHANSGLQYTIRELKWLATEGCTHHLSWTPFLPGGLPSIAIIQSTDHVCLLFCLSILFGRLTASVVESKSPKILGFLFAS